MLNIKGEGDAVIYITDPDLVKNISTLLYNLYEVFKDRGIILIPKE